MEENKYEIIVNPIRNTNSTLNLVNKKRLGSLDSNTSTTSEKSKITETSSLLRRKAMKANITKFHDTFKNRRLVVDLLAVFFGIGAWIGVNSIYLQLPLLVASAPEGWNLPSYLVVIIQLGNVGPILYTALQKVKAFRDSYMIYAVLIIGTIAALFFAFFYERTAYIAGGERSLALFILVFFLALVGCTSSVLFMPYMGRFRGIYLITYLIGEGLSGFLPSIVALIQGVGGNAQCLLNNSTDPENPEYIKYTPPPNFGTKAFFIFVFCMFVVSCISFLFLDRHKVCKKEYAAVTITHGNHYIYDDNKTDTDEKITEDFKKLSSKNYYYLAFLTGVVCMFGNGIFPGIQSFSCLPYGNIAYHLTVTMSSIANPVACFLAVFLPHTSIKSISCLSAFAGLIAAYSLATAFMSPSPPFVGTTIGNILVISSWTLLMGLVSYVRLSITTVFRYQGGKSLVLIGALTQIGSLVGSILTFSFVNYSGLFVSYEPC